MNKSKRNKNEGFLFYFVDILHSMPATQAYHVHCQCIHSLRGDFPCYLNSVSTGIHGSAITSTSDTIEIALVRSFRNEMPLNANDNGLQGE